MGSKPTSPIFLKMETAGYIYILKSKRDGRYYLGSTNDTQRRFLEHNLGKVYSTKRMLPFEFVFQQEFPSLRLARQIEIKLKKLKRKDYIEKIIEVGYIKIS